MPVRFSFIALLVLLVPVAGLATTWEIYPDGSGDAPTIQAGIDTAVDGDIIELADGTFTGDGNRDIEFLGKAITVRSQGGDPETCIIDCEGNGSSQHQGFVFVNGEDENSKLHAITIMNAYLVEGRGGAIYCYSSSPEFQDCIFSHNSNINGYTDGLGGAIYCQLSSATFTNCRFIGNSARFGGAFFCNQSSASFEACTFESNWSESYGAAIDCLNSTLHIMNCLYIDNWATNSIGLGYGGAIHMHNSQCDLNYSLFLDNMAHQGGAIYLYNNSELYCINSTFHRNSATTHGGTFYLTENSSVELVKSIITSTLSGETVFCFDGGTASLECCDIYANNEGDYDWCIGGQEGVDGNISIDPLFCYPDTADYNLDGRSPCLPENHPDGPACGLIGAFWEGCNPVLGACCLYDGPCEQLNSEDCDGIGTWLGPETDCDSDPCPPPTGACCDVLSCDCSLVGSESECNQHGVQYEFLGFGTTCDPSPCAGVGACCFPGGCIELSCEDCETAGGGYLGPETICEPGLCESSKIPETFEHQALPSLTQPWPNPTTGNLKFNIILPMSARVQVKIFAISGELVGTIVDKRLSSGVHDFTFNPLGQTGGQLPTGIYYLKLEADGIRETRRMVLIH
ncbi:MAG: T9SS type A sorting domain-containing protein [Candidatus Eisenbacteria bacterium]|uniref:T9SS type A sorting domain-containing protein n=1 Tax=Eiseniibacteriota bacterium TaxID=2212470 RepID=A0A948W4A0_UNCEI|nr:T9SS type A sorting domain-containing protein [Candidatus Eisenbacteria bacterium]MBU1948260.1 T9SS type A sorting domain-containing protein [Candidatus Eisenbacteria bacterium]MBU2691987.1 T9SS type A sorting domain-containing protein [Candidatus Eisenbacteria bacterium]